MYRIGIDVMSGDNPPPMLIEGCIQSILKQSQSKVFIIGDQKQIKQKLKQHDHLNVNDRIDIIHSREVIGMSEHPAKACRQKRDSSLMIGTQALSEGKIDAFFSPGNTGATLAGSLYSIGRLKGVKRPAIGVFMPTQEGWMLMLDAGANVDCHYKYIKQFAIMGISYFSHYFNIKNPRLGLLNVGEEDSKGNDLTKKSYKELQKLPYNFVGNIEPFDIVQGNCDVLVCDGFVGNILLKSFETVAKHLLSTFKSASKEKISYLIGSLFLKKKFIHLKEKWDAKKIGAAPLMGIAKPVFIGHGNTDAKSMEAAINTITNCLELNVQQHIQNAINQWS